MISPLITLHYMAAFSGSIRRHTIILYRGLPRRQDSTCRGRGVKNKNGTQKYKHSQSVAIKSRAPSDTVYTYDAL